MVCREAEQTASAEKSVDRAEYKCLATNTDGSAFFSVQWTHHLELILFVIEWYSRLVITNSDTTIYCLLAILFQYPNHYQMQIRLNILLYISVV